MHSVSSPFWAGLSPLPVSVTAPNPASHQLLLGTPAAPTADAHQQRMMMTSSNQRARRQTTSGGGGGVGDPSSGVGRSFGQKLEFEEADDGDANGVEKCAAMPTTETPMMPDVIPMSAAAAAAAIAAPTGDLISVSPLLGSTSQRIRRQHAATLLAGGSAATSAAMKDEASADVMMQLATPTRSPASTRASKRGGGDHHHLSLPHTDLHPHALLPTTPTRGLQPPSIPNTPASLHLMSSSSHSVPGTPANLTTSSLLHSPPTRGSRKSFTSGSSPGSDSRGSPSKTHHSHDTDSPLHPDDPYSSPSSRRGRHGRGSSPPPDFASPGGFETDGALGTPVAMQARHIHHPHQTRSAMRRAFGGSGMDGSARKTFAGVASPGMFSPAPSGMRAAAAGGDSPASPSTHSAIKQMQHALNLSTPTSTARKSGRKARAKLFDSGSGGGGDHHAPHSPLPMLLGGTSSPLSAAVRRRSRQSGGDRMLEEAAAMHGGGDAQEDGMKSSSSAAAAPGGSLYAFMFGEHATSSAGMLVDPSLGTMAPSAGAQSFHLPVQQLNQSSHQQSGPVHSGAGSAPVSLSSSQPHKPCNCKKSKCLKLYCECFARQSYCVGCNCQGCFNTPEAEHMHQPMAAREKFNTIPPMTTTAATAATMEGIPPMTHQQQGKMERKAMQQQLQQAQQQAYLAMQQQQPPPPQSSSLHHPTSRAPSHLPSATATSAAPTKLYRKGCHCKKSECLKKYCECYQAGMSCGPECKCVECKNGVEHGLHHHGHNGGAGSGLAVDKRGKMSQRKGKAAAHHAFLSSNGVGTGAGLGPVGLSSSAAGVAAAGLAMGFTDLFGGQLSAAGLTPAQVQAQAAHQAALMMPFFTPEMMASFFQAQAQVAQQQQQQQQQQQSQTMTIQQQAQLAVAAAQAAAAAANTPAPSSLLGVPAGSGMMSLSPRSMASPTTTLGGHHGPAGSATLMSSPRTAGKSPTAPATPVGAGMALSSAHATPVAPAAGSGPSGAGAEKIAEGLIGSTAGTGSANTNEMLLGRVKPEEADSKDRMDTSDDSLHVHKESPLVVDDPMSTPSVGSKRSSRVITSTSKAAEWRSAQQQKSPSAVGARGGKAAKVRLSSALESLPAGKGAGKAATGASDALLQTTLLEADAMAISASSGEEEETTPTRVSKRQRFAPPHLTA